MFLAESFFLVVECMGSSLNHGLLLGLFVRLPCYIGDLKRDPTLDNYPYIKLQRMVASLPTELLHPR